jgi:hypothetical protein
MTYIQQWRIAYKDLVKVGFRSLCVDGWAGAQTDRDFKLIDARAVKEGLPYRLPVHRGDIGARFNISCDLSGLKDSDIDFPWSYVPRHAYPPSKDLSALAGVAFFRNAHEAVLWKFHTFRSWVTA